MTLSVSAALAQQPVPSVDASPGTPSAVSDMSKLLAARISAYAEEDNSNPPAEGGIVFVGSSIWEQWSTLSQQMAPLPVYNRAIGGTRTDQQLRYMDALTLKNRPRLIVYYCGSNDVNANVDAQTIAVNFKKYAELVVQRLPDAHIIYASILRAPQKRDRWQVVDAVNAEISAYAARNHQVTFVDINPAVFDGHGNPRLDLYQHDRLHYKPQAYAAFTRLLRPFIEELWR
jgi:lysophospholipase L1-like esterase